MAYGTWHMYRTRTLDILICRNENEGGYAHILHTYDICIMLLYYCSTRVHTTEGYS